MKKTFLLLVMFSFILSGCRVPLIGKEIYIPFFEKNPQTVINLAKEKLMTLDNYRYESTLKLDVKSELAEATSKKILAFGKIYDPSRPRVLGIKVDNSYKSSSSESEFVTDNETEEKKELDFTLGSIIKDDKVDFSLSATKQGRINKTDSESVNSFKFDFGKESFNLDFENKKVEGVNYFKLNKAPAYLADFVNEYLDKWLLLDGENWSKVESKYNDNFGQNDNTLNISQEQRTRMANVSNHLSQVIKNGNLFVFDKKYDEESVRGENNYHYGFLINEEELTLLANEIADNLLAMSLKLDKNKSEKIKNGIVTFVKTFKNLKVDAWINQKDYYLQKVKFRNTFDLASVFGQGQTNKLILNNAQVDFDYEIEYFILNQTSTISKPDQTLPFSEIAEKKIFVPLLLAQTKARDYQRINDVSQLRAALEIYYNDNKKYPKNIFENEPKEESPELKKFFDYMLQIPKNPRPNDGSCPIDFEYGYKADLNGQDYELAFCLGEGKSAGYDDLKNGLNFADKKVISKNNQSPKTAVNEASPDTDGTDTDNDGLSDEKEKNVYYTDPNKQDSDGDGFSDGAEVKSGYNPNGPGKL